MIATHAPELSRLHTGSYSSSNQGNTIPEIANNMCDSPSYNKNGPYSQLPGEDIKEAPFSDTILKQSSTMNYQISSHNDISSAPTDLNNKNASRSSSPPSTLLGLQQHQMIPAAARKSSNDTSSPLTSPLKKLTTTY